MAQLMQIITGALRARASNCVLLTGEKVGGCMYVLSSVFNYVVVFLALQSHVYFVWIVS